MKLHNKKNEDKVNGTRSDKINFLKMAILFSIIQMIFMIAVFPEKFFNETLDSSRPVSESSNAEQLKPDPFENLLKEKISQVSTGPSSAEYASQAEGSAVSGSNPVGTTTLDHTERSCYVNIGNYSQPKFAYNSDCEILPKSMKEAKIALTLGKLPEFMTANFKAEKEQDVIYVFTDYTCNFCKKLHGNIERFNAKGVTVKYLLYPRILNVDPRAEQTHNVMTNMENAWCAEDQQEAFHQLYRYNSVEESTCDTKSGRIPAPLREHFALAKQIEIKYTPTIVSSKGKVSFGFSSVERTLAELGVH